MVLSPVPACKIQPHPLKSSGRPRILQALDSHSSAYNLPELKVRMGNPERAATKPRRNGHVTVGPVFHSHGPFRRLGETSKPHKTNRSFRRTNPPTLTRYVQQRPYQSIQNVCLFKAIFYGLDPMGFNKQIHHGIQQANPREWLQNLLQMMSQVRQNTSNWGRFAMVIF